MPAAVFLGSAAHSGSGEWERLEVTGTLAAGNTTARIQIRDDRAAAWDDIYIDGVQVEEKAYATSYCDGTLGTGYAWTGAAHGSTSTRAVTQVNLDAHVGLISSNATLSFRVIAQMPYDATAEWPGAAGGYLFHAWGAADQIILFFWEGDNKFYVNIDGANRLSSAAQTFKASDVIDIIVTLDFTTNDYNLYLNGELSDNDTTALAAQVLTEWNLGSSIGATQHGGFVFFEFAAFDRVLTAIEVAGMYALQRPMIDMGSLDKPGIYILDGRFRIASSTTGNRIDITADEIAGYSGAGVKQFTLQSSDGKALAGAGAVVLDSDGLYTVGDGTGLAMKLRFQYDDAGTAELTEYFGDVVFRFTLEQAIGKCLVPYDYYLHEVQLTDQEVEKWLDLTEQLRRKGWKFSGETEGEMDRNPSV